MVNLSMTDLNTILFDLDGTLLPLDIDKFMNIYFHEMGIHFYDIIDPQELVKHIWASTEVMVKNIEYKTNEEVFMEDFSRRIRGNLDTFKKRFDDYYNTGFLKVKDSVSESVAIRESVKLLKEKGYDLIIATNPLFPEKAILHRIRWAGFEPEDFSYITSYEKNHYCKPQLNFYKEILSENGKTPSECLMVGNDVQEDIIAGQLGISTFLIEDYIINRTSDGINADFVGSYENFLSFVDKLPSLR